MVGVALAAAVELSAARTSVATQCPPGSVDLCPLQGCSNSTNPHAAFDPLLNVQKNHAAGPPASRPRVFSAADMMNPNVLPVHKGSGKDIRSTWRQTQAFQLVSQTETRQATIEGYVATVKPGSAESCNCEFTGAANVDTHVNVIDRPANPNADTKTFAAHSVIAEVTWRIRNADHPDWTVGNLKQLDLANRGARVRITGDLLYDNVHLDMIRNGFRGTLWEIHPIRRIQIFSNRKWIDFSTAPGSQSMMRMSPHAAGAPDAIAATPAKVPLTDAWTPHWNAAQIQRLQSSFKEDES